MLFVFFVGIIFLAGAIAMLVATIENCKHNNERYQLKTKIGYSMIGKEVSKTYTLVIPVDVIQKGW